MATKKPTARKPPTRKPPTQKPPTRKPPTQKPTAKKPTAKKKLKGIDPKSVPGRVLKERQKKPGPLGSRSNPWPAGTPAWKKAGLKSKTEYDKLPQKYKDILN